MANMEEFMSWSSPEEPAPTTERHGETAQPRAESRRWLVAAAVVFVGVAGVAIMASAVVITIRASALIPLPPETLTGFRHLIDGTDRAYAAQVDPLGRRVESAIAGEYPSANVDVYTNADENQFLFAATAQHESPFTYWRILDRFTDALSRDGISTSPFTALDPGRRGGQAKCGSVDWIGTTMDLCVWVDRGTVGAILAAKDTLQPDFIRMRNSIEESSLEIESD
ncbi:hypothetical protein GCM10022223_51610 [Kineosporia mesophila]|uniref:Uncharacterized protein n=1 Tax=Kineosporia mesophila TaxID=566012 RepID=A0ABP7AA03_9ACTN|nr:hypothetical protein [Kineosporia mesophila]MCD5354652.1 hypothetical protein [Kineosporia mesophila]